MPKKFQKTLSIGLTSLLALGIGVAQAAERVPNVLHEMVPHVVLPETIQYNKTAKNMPGNDYNSVTASHVGTYIAHPSYQVPSTTEFKSVGQSVYPISPTMAPAVAQESDPDTSGIEKELIRQNNEEKTTVTKETVSEPIRLASVEEEVIPTLPSPKQSITQTGIFCQHPADPPSAWAFSSPIFKVASVPSSWGNGQVGTISQNGLKGCSQQVNFQPSGVVADPALAANGAMPQGIPYSTFQMGRPESHNTGPQAQILPNGMVLLTMPPDHGNCGLIRCRANHTPRTILLPPAPAGYNFPQVVPQQMQQTMPQEMPTSVQPETAMYSPFGMPSMPMALMPMMNPMATSPIALMNMNQQTNSPFSQIQQVQMTTAQTNPSIASQAGGVAASGNTPTEGAEPQSADSANNTQSATPMTMVATPFGYYAVQASADMASPLPPMQVPPQPQANLHNQWSNPYMGLYSTPFGYVAMNPMGQYNNGFGMPMMNAGYSQMGAPAGGQGGMSVSDMIMIMTFLNNNNRPHQRRARLMDRIAERREHRQANAENDPFAQLMQAWTTPYVAPDTTLRMPARNAYPYGYFGVQASPISTANNGGYHNLSFGSTTYPGMQ